MSASSHQPIPVVWQWMSVAMCKEEPMAVLGSSGRRFCDQLMTSSMKTRMRYRVLCVKYSPSQGQMSSVMPGFRAEWPCSRGVRSTDSSTNSLSQVPAQDV